MGIGHRTYVGFVLLRSSVLFHARCAGVREDPPQISGILLGRIVVVIVPGTFSLLRGTPSPPPPHHHSDALNPMARTGTRLWICSQVLNALLQHLELRSPLVVLWPRHICCCRYCSCFFVLGTLFAHYLHRWVVRIFPALFFPDAKQTKTLILQLKRQLLQNLPHRRRQKHGRRPRRDHLLHSLLCTSSGCRNSRKSVTTTLFRCCFFGRYLGWGALRFHSLASVLSLL